VKDSERLGVLPGEVSPTAVRINVSVSIDEAIALFPGQWILMKVTTYDQDHCVSHGEVIAHGSNKTVEKALSRLSAMGKSPPPSYYLFSAVARLRTGADLRAALDDAANAEASGAWREW
jgi:hypothetical protein